MKGEYLYGINQMFRMRKRNFKQGISLSSLWYASPIRRSGHKDIDEYRVEFVTPPLHYSDIETLQAIIRKFKEIGGVPHNSCGIHIHVDGENHTANSLRRMVSFMYSRQDIIYEALGVEDRKYSW